MATKNKISTFLQTMSKDEKKEFLSMDLAERMMRIEQSVCSSFNNYVPYNRTEYYKSMSKSEQERFNSFIKHKSKKKLCLFSLALVPILLLLFMQFKTTGNVVKSNIGNSGAFSLQIVLIIMAILILYWVLSYFIMHRKHEHRFNKHLNLLRGFINKNK